MCHLDIRCPYSFFKQCQSRAFMAANKLPVWQKEFKPLNLNFLPDLSGSVAYSGVYLPQKSSYCTLIAWLLIAGYLEANHDDRKEV